MQPKGSLAENSLRSLLESAQTERATGTLSVQDGDRACKLYFLFGHLFHATAGEAAGDDAVMGALRWGEGEFDFDAKAKLPPDETVRSTIPDLIQRAGTASDPGPEPPPEAAGEPGEPVAADQPASPEPVQKAAEEPPGEPIPVPSPAPPAAEAPGGAARPETEPPQPRRGVKHRPHPPGREPVPVPAGQTLYDSLKTSFVDFPRLVSTLEKEGYTGYVRLLTDQASGLIFFREGQALECVYDDGTMRLGRPALSAFNEQVTRGQGVLDVVGLSPEVVDGLYQLTAAQPVYTELYGSWVDMKALLSFLRERDLTGSVMVRAEAGTGVIILTEGEVTGSYTSEARDIASSVDGVLALCTDPRAMIEVKAAGSTATPALEPDEALRAQPSPPRAPEPMLAVLPPVSEPSPPRHDPAQESSPTVVPAPVVPVPEPAQTQRLLDPAITQTLPLVPQSQLGVDWDQVVGELQLMAEEALGNRARKVKEILAGAGRSRPGVEEAIGQVPTISLLFVDSSRLEGLAEDMRVKLESLTS